jgi:hypothetical protein
MSNLRDWSCPKVWSQWLVPASLFWQLKFSSPSNMFWDARTWIPAVQPLTPSPPQARVFQTCPGPAVPSVIARPQAPCIPCLQPRRQPQCTTPIHQKTPQVFFNSFFS